MKIKPIYLYGGILVLAAAFLFFFTSKNNSIDAGNIETNEMPDDDIHKDLKNPTQKPPGKENVSTEVKHQLDMLKKSVDENPKDTLKMREYADLLAAAHHPEEAVIYYYQVLNINPRRTDILASLAFVYYNQKDYDKASNLTSKILLYEPDNTEAMYNLGAIAATSGNKTEAKKHWEEIVKKYPDSKESALARNSLTKL
ncbi:MAG TPA: tetratricopeptide repeat protein [Ignavibacteriaceae bacterium]|nr:tetratricopeptide repeat protein [Ignavibacteriaceae bacterium]